MTWLTSNLLWPFCIGIVLVVLSTLRLRLASPVWWRMLSLGVLLLFIGAIGIAIVIRGTPGQQPTVVEPLTPHPSPPVEPHLERLKLPWSSEGPATWPMAETLATLSDLAYLPPYSAMSEVQALGFDDVMPIVAGSMIGYIASGSDVTVVVFRGTDAGETSDWLANLGRNSANTAHGAIHKGFYLAYQSLRPQIDDVLAAAKPKYVWITGHSLGGALAVVCAYDLLETDPTRLTGLMTFGQPMVVRRDLADYLDQSLFGRYVHFVNEADVVPRVPPSHVHCGSLVWFKEGTVQRSPPKQPVFGAAADAPTASKQVELPIDGEIPPLSEREFKALQTRMRAEESKKNADSDQLDVAPMAYGAPAFIEDHSMTEYLLKIRSHLGVSQPK